MITIKDICQCAKDNNLSDNTDIFFILSSMQLDYRVKLSTSIVDKTSITHIDKIEYSTQDVLDLFST